MGQIRVVIADGSAAERRRLAGVLHADPDMIVVGEAGTGAAVVEMAMNLRPDIIALDMRLPAALGFDTTKEIMADAPTPIVVLSESGDEPHNGASTSALTAGALAVVARPPHRGPASTGAEEQRFISTVKAMSQVKVVRHWRDRAPPPVTARRRAAKVTPARIVAVAASTGGPSAIQQMLADLPSDFAVPILVVQHIGVGYIDGLARWLAGATPLDVRVARQGEKLEPGNVYFAPDNFHLGLADKQTIQLSDAPPIGGFRPSATFLFESVAKTFGNAAVHLIMTGMGQDGVAGLRAARKAGGTVIAQDAESSVVFGMPGEAISAGVVDFVTPLKSLAQDLSVMVK